MHQGTLSSSVDLEAAHNCFIFSHAWGSKETGVMISSWGQWVLQLTV